jgi:predicted phosphodiesterase
VRSRSLGYHCRMSHTTHVSRRRLLQASVSTLLAANLWPGALWADNAAGDGFSFIIVNDLHCIDKDCHPHLERVAALMKAIKQKADLCFINGDLSENGTKEQLAPVREIFKNVAPALRVTCGNHDYETDEKRSAFEDLFPKSLNYTFEHKGWQFVGLDSTQGLRADATIQPPTFKWLDETLLKLDKKRPLILITHFPLGPNVTFRPTNADELLARLKEYNLRTVFNGHYHAFTERTVNDLLITTNRCCALKRHNFDGTKEKGFFVCRAHDGKVTREFIEVPMA